MIRALFLAALLSPQAAAQSGLTGAATLRRPLSARAVGMAEAFTAVSGGLASQGHNPAGLTGLKKPELRTTYTHGIVDDKFTFLTYGMPTGPLAVTAGLMYYDGGSINVNLSDGTRAKRKAAQDFVGVFGLGLPLGPLSIGGQLKAMRLTLGDAATATGAAVDAGVLWRTPLKGLSLGASLLNMGPDVKYESAGDPLPLSARGGAAYTFELTQDTFAFSEFTVALDMVKTRDEETTGSAGLEMQMNVFEQSRLWLRFGHLLNKESNAFSTGVGMSEGRFSLDYAMGIMRRLNNVHHLTFGISF